MSMSNSEHIEEILFEASAYGIRLEVMQLASKLREDDNTISKINCRKKSWFICIDTCLSL